MSAWKVEISRSAGWFRVQLVVGPQSFCVTPLECDSREEAEAIAGFLRHAILAIERGVLEEAMDAGIAAGRDTDRNSAAYGTTLARIRALITSRLPSCSGCTKPDGGTHSEGTKDHP